MIDFATIVEHETAAMADLLESLSPEIMVPTCPGWSVADLGAHLTAVQSVFAEAVESRATEPVDVEPARPADGEIPPALRAAGRRLVAALRSAPEGAETMTWAGLQPVSWSARRQAHEVLIHHVDAKRAAGLDAAIDRELAAAGIDELAEWHHGPAPEWATWTPSRAVLVEQSDGDRAWRIERGHLSGTSPNTGASYDLTTVCFVEPGPTEAVVRAGASDLDLWLWRRLPFGAVEVDGDRALAGAVYEDLVVD
ncbi:MAG: maleylpyruvate isomerase family mycothiol-dependent enzyme [Acidimicrobiia bacterium]|nr:maleylpyruvate isomerase family mycothiol-dependent enzyme [Acidimicrobiia bacterium]